MKLKLALLALWLAVVPAAAQQSVKQSGNVTPGHAAMWTTNGVIQDAGTVASPNLTSLGVTNSGLGICQNSGAITGAYNAFCFSVTNSGAGLSLTNNGGATGGFTLTLNGVTQNFITAPSNFTTSDMICANGTTSLKDCGFSTTLGTTNQIAYWSSATVLTSFATANNGVVVTSGGGVPSISSTLPTAVQNNITQLTTVTVSGSETITPGSANTTPLTISGGSITGSSTVIPGISVSATLNTTGVVDGAAFLANITNTASNAASSAITVQSSSADKFQVWPDGTVLGAAFPFGSLATIGTGNVDAAFNAGVNGYQVFNLANLREQLVAGFLRLTSSDVFQFWSGGNILSGSADTGLSRDSAGVIDFGNGTASDKSGTINATNINAITVFKLNGTSGVTQTCTVNQAKTLIFTGGILTGGTCNS